MVLLYQYLSKKSVTIPRRQFVFNSHYDEKGKPSVQAELRFEVGACHTYSIDFTIGCSHNCIYCYFSELQKITFKKAFREYRGNIIVMDIDNLLSLESYPTQIYLSYATDPFAPAAQKAAHKVIARLVNYNVQLTILTKGIIPEHTIELLDQYCGRGGQVTVQVGIANLSHDRNKMIEPSAASAEDRLSLLNRLNKTKISVVAARADPVFALIDDTENELCCLLDSLVATGTKNLIVSYLVASRGMIRRMSNIEDLKSSLAMLTDETPTVALSSVYSVPQEYKLSKLRHIFKLCSDRSISFHCCGCKDKRLVSSGLSSVCHPRDTNDFVGDYTAPGNLLLKMKRHTE